MATDNTTVGIIGGLGILVVIFDLVFAILLWKQRTRWREHHTLITMTHSSRGSFNLADFTHNLTYGGLIPLSHQESMDILKETPVDMGPWDEESELSQDQVTNAERRKQIYREKSGRIQKRLELGKIKNAIQRQTEIETALQRAGKKDFIQNLKYRKNDNL